MKLSEVPVGKQVRITEMNMDAQTQLRLRSLGMLPETKIRVLQKKGSGTLVLELRGSRFALGSLITRKVECQDA